eukprot:8675040-Alexandrium_andersonii.AAC.1
MSCSSSSAGNGLACGVTCADPFSTECASVEEMFPGLVGRERQEAIRSIYFLKEGATLQFFSDDHEPLLHRHALNDRFQQDTVNRYKAIALETGIIRGVR